MASRSPARLLFCLISLYFGVPAGFAQNTTSPAYAPPDDDLKTDTDPTRAILFSIRPEFYNFGSGVQQESLILRYDMAALRRRKLFAARTGVLFRMEAPLVISNVAAGARAGLGDVYAQFLSAAYLSRRFALFWGSGLAMPTATQAAVGRGKWILAPALAPLWFIPHRGMFFAKLQNFVSVAGNRERSDLNYLLVTPTLIYRVNRQWWIIADTETKTNWEIGRRTDVKSGFQVGTHSLPGLAHGLSRKYGGDQIATGAGI